MTECRKYDYSMFNELQRYRRIHATSHVMSERPKPFNCRSMALREVTRVAEVTPGHAGGWEQ